MTARHLLIFSFAILGLLQGRALANTVLEPTLFDQATIGFFNPQSSRRVGIEIELKGLTAKKITEILQEYLGGTIESDSKIVEFTTQTRSLIQMTYTQYRLQGSALGRVVIKPEDNSLTEGEYLKTFNQWSITEIVLDPIPVSSVGIFQKALDGVVAKGASGTDDHTAVSLQLNVELADGHPQKSNPAELLAILRSYLIINYDEIQKTWAIPQVRKSYLGQHTRGFMRLLANPSYSPDWQRFYIDFMYRQSLEMHGYSDAWIITDEEASLRVKRELGARGIEAFLPILKWNHIKVASLLLHVMPDEWFSKEVIKTGWIQAVPAIEFRDPNNDFRVDRTVSRVFGLVESAKKIGPRSFSEMKRIGQKQSCAAIFIR